MRDSSPASRLHGTQQDRCDEGWPPRDLTGEQRWLAKEDEVEVRIMKKLELKVIDGQKELKRALAAIERLWDSKPGTEEHDELEVLAMLAEDYEKRAVPMEEPDPVEAIRFRHEQMGKEQNSCRTCRP